MVWRRAVVGRAFLDVRPMGAPMSAVSGLRAATVTDRRRLACRSPRGGDGKAIPAIKRVPSHKTEFEFILSSAIPRYPHQANQTAAHDLSVTMYASRFADQRRGQTHLKSGSEAAIKKEFRALLQYRDLLQTHSPRADLPDQPPAWPRIDSSAPLSEATSPPTCP